MASKELGSTLSPLAAIAAGENGIEINEVDDIAASRKSSKKSAKRISLVAQIEKVPSLLKKPFRVSQKMAFTISCGCQISINKKSYVALGDPLGGIHLYEVSDTSRNLSICVNLVPNFEGSGETIAAKVPVTALHFHLEGKDLYLLVGFKNGKVLLLLVPITKISLREDKSRSSLVGIGATSAANRRLSNNSNVTGCEAWKINYDKSESTVHSLSVTAYGSQAFVAIGVEAKSLFVVDLNKVRNNKSPTDTHYFSMYGFNTAQGSKLDPEQHSENITCVGLKIAAKQNQGRSGRRVNLMAVTGSADHTIRLWPIYIVEVTAEGAGASGTMNRLFNRNKSVRGGDESSADSGGTVSSSPDKGGHSDAVTSVIFYDDSMIISGDSSGEVIVWDEQVFFGDQENNKPTYLIPLRRFNNHKSAFITSISMLKMITPEHSYNPILVVAGNNGFSLWSFFEQEEFRQLPTDGKNVETLLLDYLDYDNILTYNFWTSVSMEDVLTTWNFASGEVENILQMETSMEGHSGKITAMALYEDSDDQMMLLTASKVDKSVRLFETANAKQVSLILNEAKQQERVELNQFNINRDNKDLSCSYSEVIGAYPTAICAIPKQGILIGTDKGELSFWRFDEENQPIRVSAIMDMQCDGITAITSFITASEAVIIAIGSADRRVKLITGLTEPGAQKLSNVNDLSGSHLESTVQSLIIWKSPSEETENMFLIANGNTGKVCIWSFDPDKCFDDHTPLQLMQVVFHNGNALLYACEEYIISVGTEDGMLLTWAPQTVKTKNKKEDLKNKFILHDSDTQESFLKTLGIKSKVAAIGICFDREHERKVFVSFENGEVCVLDPITKDLVEPAKYHPEGKVANEEVAASSASSKNGVAEQRKVLKHFQSTTHFSTGLTTTVQPVRGAAASSQGSSHITGFVHFELTDTTTSVWIGGTSDGKLQFRIDIPETSPMHITTEGRTGAIQMMRSVRIMKGNDSSQNFLLALKNDGTLVQADLCRGRVKDMLPLECEPEQADFPDSEIFIDEIIAFDVNEAVNDDDEDDKNNADVATTYALCAYQKLVTLFALTIDNSNKQRKLESEYVLSRYYKDEIIHARLCVPDASDADMIMITAHVNCSYPIQLVHVRNREMQNTTKVPSKKILEALKPIEPAVKKVDITCMAVAQTKQTIFVGFKATRPMIIHFKDEVECELFAPDASLKGNVTCIDVAEVNGLKQRKSNAEIVTGHNDGTVVAWDLKGKKVRYTCDAVDSGAAITTIKLVLDLSVIVGKADSFIIIGAEDNSIRLLSFANSLNVLRIFEVHAKPITAIELLLLGNRDPMLFTASEDTLLIARDTYFMVTKTLPGPRSVAKNFSLDCKTLAAASNKASKKANATKPWSRIELLLKGVAKNRASFFAENAQLFADCALLVTDQGLSFLQKYLQHASDHVLSKYYPVIDASHTVSTHMNLLEIAIESDNKRAVSIVVDALLKELNQSLDDKDDFLPQLYPPGLHLSPALVQILAEKYPVLFNGFICGIKLMKVHPNLLGGTKVKFAFKEDENEFAQVDAPRNLLTLWPTIDGPQSSLNKSSGINGKEEWAIAMYIPLPFAANNETLGAFIKNCQDVNNVNLYDSDVGKLTLSFSWRTFGQSVHWRTFGKHLVYTTIYSVSLFIFSYWSHGGESTNDQSTKNFLSFLAYLSVAIGLIASTYFLGMEVKEVYVTDKGDWSKHFSEMWNVIDAMTHVTMFSGAIARLSAGDDTVFSRSTLAFCGIFIYFKILYFLRAFPLTGPLVKMVFQIAADIRPFLLVLWIVIFGFSQAFWIISNISSSNPFGVFSLGMLNMFNYMMGNFDSGFDGTAQGQVGTVLFIIFMLGVPLLLLNLLIALMGDSFANVRARGEAQYRLEQATILHEQFYLVSSEAAFDPKFIHVLVRGTDVELQQDNQEDAAMLSEKVSALESKLDKILKMMSASQAFAAVTLSDSEDEDDDDDDDDDSDEDSSDEDDDDSDDYDDGEEDEDAPPEEESAGMQDKYKSWLHEHLLERSSGEGWGCDGRRQPGGCKQGCTGFRQSAGWTRFRCDDCDFDLCTGCVLLTREADTDKPQLMAYTVSCHEHPVMRCFDKRGWNCDGSNMDGGCQKAKESGGDEESVSTKGWLRHRCNICDFDLCLPCVNKYLASTAPLAAETKPAPRKDEDHSEKEEDNESEEEEEKEDEADDSDSNEEFGRENSDEEEED